MQQTTTFYKLICTLTPEDRDILKILWKKRRNCSLGPLFSTIFCYLLLDFHVETGMGFSLRDKQLFEINSYSR